MRYIQKQLEPEFFILWKNQANKDWQPSWDSLQNPEKAQLFECLCKEQGFLCCYCGARVENSQGAHIEHVKPRHQFHSFELNYNNLVVSCNGQEPCTDITRESCGHKKDRWYDEELFITPQREECESYFSFTALGTMIPTIQHGSDNAGRETIDKLGLNNQNLIRRREKAIEGITEVMDNLSEEEETAVIEGLRNKDTSGKLTPFYFAILSVLQSK